LVPGTGEEAEFRREFPEKVNHAKEAQAFRSVLEVLTQLAAKLGENPLASVTETIVRLSQEGEGVRNHAAELRAALKEVLAAKADTLEALDVAENLVHSLEGKLDDARLAFPAVKGAEA
jgi:hypothetical protein